MTRYFQTFEVVQHTHKNLLDITRRFKVNQTLLFDPLVFLPLVVEEGERPEDIAYYYYGDVNLVWLVYYANGIIDPYKQWPMSQREFNKFIINKYRESSGQSLDQDVLNWVKSTTKYYRLINDKDITISVETFSLNSLDSEFQASEWEQVFIFEYENQINENRRNVFVINKIYVNDFISELKGSR